MSRSVRSMWRRVATEPCRNEAGTCRPVPMELEPGPGEDCSGGRGSSGGSPCGYGQRPRCLPWSGGLALPVPGAGTAPSLWIMRPTSIRGQAYPWHWPGPEPSCCAPSGRSSLLPTSWETPPGQQAHQRKLHHGPTGWTGIDGRRLRLGRGGHQRHGGCSGSASHCHSQQRPHLGQHARWTGLNSPK